MQGPHGTYGSDGGELSVPRTCTISHPHASVALHRVRTLVPPLTLTIEICPGKRLHY